MFYKILFSGLITTLLFVISIFWVLLPKTSHFLTKEKEVSLQNLVQVAESALQKEIQKWKRGELSENEAQANALSVIKDFGYDGGNYFWINDMDYVMLMHPTSPELVGQDRCRC